MKFKCLIIDDEQIAQNILKTYIKDTPTLELVQVCDNALEALKVLNEKNIDLLFLDIEMPKLNGIDFLKSLPDRPAIILTTAYREFALEGYELNILDYLLKPFSFERFLRAINKFGKMRSKEGLPMKKDEMNYIYFKCEGKNVRVNYDEILFFEGLGNYVKINLENDETLVIYNTLIELIKLLPPKKFTRIHKSYIVAVQKISAYGNDYVEIGEKQLSIGNTFKENFLENLF